MTTLQVISLAVAGIAALVSFALLIHSILECHDRACQQRHEATRLHLEATRTYFACMAAIRRGDVKEADRLIALHDELTAQHDKVTAH